MARGSGPRSIAQAGGEAERLDAQAPNSREQLAKWRRRFLTKDEDHEAHEEPLFSVQVSLRELRVLPDFVINRRLSDHETCGS